MLNRTYSNGLMRMIQTSEYISMTKGLSHSNKHEFMIYKSVGVPIYSVSTR